MLNDTDIIKIIQHDDAAFIKNMTCNAYHFIC